MTMKLPAILFRNDRDTFPFRIFIGSLVVLLPVFVFLTVANINRQEEISVRLLKEKGAALIRSFEAGTRAGMMASQWSLPHLQRLIDETVQLEDIDYIMVVNPDGLILAHSDTRQIGQFHAGIIDLPATSGPATVKARIVKRPQVPPVFEVYKRFTPSAPPHGMMMHGQRGPGRRRPDHWLSAIGDIQKDAIIAVGLRMDTFEAARRNDIQRSVILAVVMLLVGVGGVMVLFLAHRYRMARSSLSRVTAFSDKLVESMPMGLIALDPDLRIASMNSVAETLLQLHAADVVGKLARHRLPHELLAPLTEPDAQLPLIERELVVQVPAGGGIALALSVAILYEAQHKMLGYVLLFKDLTEIRQLQKEVARNQRLAAVGRLAAGVAHEIRNPLSTIKGFATYFHERCGHDPSQGEIAQLMIHEIERLNRVVGQLLDFSRPLKIVKTPVAVNAFIQETLHKIQPLAREKKVRLAFEGLTADGTVALDKDRMNQVLLNLYLNALEAMPDGGELRVVLEKNTGLNQIVVTVADTGTGIDEKNIARIFDPYFTTKSTGTGLGLAIAHNILEAHAGDIAVQSRPGQGTRIRLTLR
jgi:two-component system sensor histidine kinase HydH